MSSSTPPFTKKPMGKPGAPTSLTKGAWAGVVPTVPKSKENEPLTPHEEFREVRETEPSAHAQTIQSTPSTSRPSRHRAPKPAVTANAATGPRATAPARNGAHRNAYVPGDLYAEIVHLLAARSAAGSRLSINRLVAIALERYFAHTAGRPDTLARLVDLARTNSRGKVALPFTVPYELDETFAAHCLGMRLRKQETRLTIGQSDIVELALGDLLRAVARDSTSALDPPKSNEST